MAFEATKKEWCELYSFFRLLADGKVVLGTAEAKAGDTFWPVAMIQREEHDGTRQYYIEEDTIRIEGENGSKSMPREDFGIVADLILQAVKSSPENDVASPEGVEEFLDEAAIFDLEAKQKIAQIFHYILASESSVKRFQCPFTVGRNESVVGRRTCSES